MNLQELRQQIYDRHDIYCNQKYGDGLPYSFHLKAVEAQGYKFLHLIDISTKKDIVKLALCGHDLLEDARMSYNDISKLIGGGITGEFLANIIYCVTDEKGKNRKERKNDKYYKELKENKLAVFVKLADISANTLYSKLTGSSMYEKYKKEFPMFKEKCYVEEYKEFFDYLESL